MRRDTPSVNDPEVVMLSAILGATPEKIIQWVVMGQRATRIRVIRRLVAVSAAFVAVAVLVVGALYGFILLVSLAFGAAPVTDVQLPTL